MSSGSDQPGFRITQVVQELSTEGGVETVAWELQRAWTKARVPNTTLASVTQPDAPGAVQLVAPWLARVPTRGALRHAGRLFVVPAFTLAVTRRLRRDAGVVLSHGDSLSGDVLVVHAVNRASLRQKRAAGERSWMLNPMHAWVAARDRWMIGGLRYRVIVAVSARVRRELIEHYAVPDDRIRIIANGIALDRFFADPVAGRAIRAEFAIPPEARLLLFAGHEFGRKGLEFAAGALARMPADTWLLVVGAGDPAPYRRFAADAAQRLIFAGARRDMPAFYSAADVFVLPSAYETFSLVCMEAMACGVPVFACPVGGIEDYLQDELNGMAVPRDAAALALALTAALSDPQAMQAMQAGARQTAARYGWDAVAAEYLALLQETWCQKARERDVT